MSQLELGTPPPSAVGAAESMWREKYLVARRRGRVFLAIAVVAFAGACASVAWGVSQQPDELTPLAAEGGAGPEDLGPGAGGGPGMRGTPLEELFGADGSVDEGAVSEFLATVPEGLDPAAIVQRGLQRGALDQDQAAALLDAFAQAA